MVEIQPGHLLIGCVICIMIYRVHKSNETYAFMILLILSTFVAYHFIDKQNDIVIKTMEQEQNKDILQVKNVEMPSDIYKVYKHPPSLKYSRRIKDYYEIVQKLEFVQKYDKQKLNQIKSICEHFFKVHFNMMIGKYEPGLYISDLYDAKTNALNIMNELVYVLPKISRLVDIPDIDKLVYKLTLQLSAVLSRYIKIVHHAFPSETQTISHHPPYAL